MAALVLACAGLVAFRDSLPGFLGEAGQGLAALIGMQTAELRPTQAALQVGTLVARLDSVERDLKALRAAPRPDADSSRQAVEGLARQVADLERRVSGAEAAVAAAPTAQAAEGARATANAAAIEALATRLSAVEAAGAGRSSEAAAVEALTARLAAIDGSLARLADIPGRVEALEARPVPSGDPEARARGAAVFAALAGLRPALAAGMAFEAALAPLQTAAGGEPDVKSALVALAAHGATGVPTAAQLHGRLEQAAPAILKAAAPPAEGWAGQTLQRLASVITVRRLDAPPDGADAESVLARAEQALARGDVAAAVAAVEQFPEPARALTAPWLAEARARLAVDGAVAAIEARAVALVIDAGQARR